MEKAPISWLDRLIPEPNSGCWLWDGDTPGDGYALVSVNGRTRSLHRLMWEYVNGPIPAGFHVLHRCDVRSCGNPDHLFLGTHQDNMKDMQQKGRATGGRGAGGKDRLSVGFTAPQISWLRREAKRLGLTLGELLRRIIDTARDSR